MMKNLLLLLLLYCLIRPEACSRAAGRIPPQRILFYNVENLFDVRDDPLTADEEFTPGGERHWTRSRYIRKLQRIAEAIGGAGGGGFPLLVGLAEVENRRVVEDLAGRTSLADAGYGIVHGDSPDPRGIDVALLFRRRYARLLFTDFHPVPARPDSGFRSRDILYVKFLVVCDTLHVYVCHFPSMRGGERRSEWKRVEAAMVLRSRTDSLFRLDPDANVLIMGDMNGKADSRALRRLGALDPQGGTVPGRLYNTGWHLLDSPFEGSYRFRGRWQTLDHIIASGGLLEGRGRLKTGSRMSVHAPDHLLEADRNHWGYRPWPTYWGRRYSGGYSDHLPVYLGLEILSDYR